VQPVLSAVPANTICPEAGTGVAKGENGMAEDARGNLIDRLAEQIGVPPLTQDEVDAVLELAAQAAHGTGDRTSAPLASFLAGIAAADTDDRAAAIVRLRDAAASIAPLSES
jgi:Domain of unknown function (DUF6457)